MTIFLDNTVIPSLLEYSHTLMDKVELLDNNFHMYESRLQKIREELQEKFDSICNDGDFYLNKDIELFSDTSSVSSGHLSKRTSSSRK